MAQGGIHQFSQLSQEKMLWTSRHQLNSSLGCASALFTYAHLHVRATAIVLGIRLYFVLCTHKG